MTPNDDIRRLWRECERNPRVAEEVCLHDWRAEVAEYRLRHQGIKPELLRYVEGIGEAVR